MFVSVSAMSCVDDCDLRVAAAHACCALMAQATAGSSEQGDERAGRSWPIIWAACAARQGARWPGQGCSGSPGLRFANAGARSRQRPATAGGDRPSSDRGASMAETDRRPQKARAAAWFRELRDRDRGGLRGAGGQPGAGPFADRPAGRFEVTRRRSAGEDGEARRRADERDARRPGVREGRRQRLDRPRRAGRRGADGDGGARRAGDRGRPALLGLGHQPGGPHAEPAYAGGAHEHADVLDARAPGGSAAGRT